MRQLPTHKDRRLEIAMDALQQAHLALVLACQAGNWTDVWTVAGRLERVLTKSLGVEILKPTKKKLSP